MREARLFGKTSFGATPDQPGYNLHQYPGWTGVFTGNMRVVMAVANGYVGRGQ